MFCERTRGAFARGGSAASDSERGRLQICEWTSHSLQAGGKMDLHGFHSRSPVWIVASWFVYWIDNETMWELRAFQWVSDAQRDCRLSQESAACQWRSGIVRVEGADDVLIIQGAVCEDTSTNVASVRGQVVSARAIRIHRGVYDVASPLVCGDQAKAIREIARGFVRSLLAAP